MNHQGGAAEQQVNFDNANIQNRVGPHLSMETLQRLFPSSSSLTVGSHNRFLDRLNSSNMILPQQSANIVPNNGHNASVTFQDSINGAIGLSISSSSFIVGTTQRFPHRLFGSNDPLYQANEGDNPPINLELSLSLTQAPSETQSQGAISSSTLNAIDNVAPSYVVQEQSSSPNQDFFFTQHDTPIFSGSSETTATNLPQQLELASNFHQVLHGSPQIDNMSSRNAPQIIRLPYSQIRTEVISPLFGQRNIQGSNMFGSQVQRAIQENSLVNLGFEGTTNMLGDFPNRSHQNEFWFTTNSNANVPNAPPRVHRRLNSNEPMQILPRPIDANGKLRHATAIVYPGQSTESPLTLGPSQSLQEMNLPTVIFDFGAENQRNSRETIIVQFGGNVEPIISIPSSVTLERRRRITVEVRSILDRLCSGRSLMLEELMALDYSLVLRSFELQGIIRQNNQATKRLTIEEIMLHIRHENFKSTCEETPKSKESCCICLEDYVDGDEVGRLDCVHKFHVECIKQWLLQKNVCPICKRMALAINYQ